MLKLNTSISKITTFIILLAFSVVLTGCQATLPAIEDPKDEPVAEAPNSDKPISLTDDWQVYKNEDYRFELKYPKDWVIVEDLAVGFGTPDYKPHPLSPTPRDVMIFFNKNPDNLEMTDFYNGKLKANLFEDALDGNFPIKVDGMPARRFSNVIGETMSEIVVIPMKGLMLEINALTNHKETLDQMTSTFNFLDF